MHRSERHALIGDLAGQWQSHIVSFGRCKKDRSLIPLGIINIQTIIVKPAGFELWFKICRKTSACCLPMIAHVDRVPNYFHFSFFTWRRILHATTQIRYGSDHIRSELHCWVSRMPCPMPSHMGTAAHRLPNEREGRVSKCMFRAKTKSKAERSGRVWTFLFNSWSFLCNSWSCCRGRLLAWVRSILSANIDDQVNSRRGDKIACSESHPVWSSRAKQTSCPWTKPLPIFES